MMEKIHDLMKSGRHTKVTREQFPDDRTVARRKRKQKKTITDYTRNIF